jgi:hypothetical protein
MKEMLGKGLEKEEIVKDDVKEMKEMLGKGIEKEEIVKTEN